MLKWPKHHSNTAVCVAIRLQSVQSRVLERKFRFLQQVVHAEAQFVSGSVCVALCDDITASSLMQECRDLEEICGVLMMESIVKGDLTWSKEARDRIR